jgi:PAS domain S-box-containing protein
MAAIEALAALRGSKLGLRAHLVIFGLAIVVPVLIYSAFVLNRYTQSVHASNARRALETARALSADIDREITAITTTLEALATSRSLLYGDFADFYAQATEALKSRSWNAVLIGAKRQQLVNTRVPWGTPLPTGTMTEPDLLRVARESQQPYVSDLFTGTVARRPIFSVSVPVRKGDEIPYVLVMSLEPDRLVEILAGESLPPGWLAAVADKKNINMARTRLAKEFLGRPIPEASVRQYGGRTEGVIETTDFEGQPSLQAFHWSRLTGWRVATWAPLSVVEGQLRQAWRLFFWSGAVLLSLSLLTALGVGRLMAAPMAELMHAGSALGEGKPVSPIASTLREADELSLVLSKAAEELGIRMGAQAHLAAIVTSSPSAVVGLSPGGIIRTWNAAATHLFGYEEAEVIGKPMSMLAPEGAGGDTDRLNASARAGSTVHEDTTRRHKDGRLIDVSVSVAPMYDEARNLIGISAIVSDIGERRARERHIEFLMREVSHRSKNLLAVVQAIAGQTARHSANLEEFQGRFSQRIAAMARSQDLLVGRNWASASVADLVRTQLAPFAEAASSRVEVSGPRLELKPNAVHSLTLALHELATNAAKYGALSVPEGCVVIGWEVSAPETAEGRFRMTWREKGGPPVSQPDRQGFGHVVISEMVGSSLHGDVTLDYAREGLQWAIDTPRSTALADG